MTDKKALILNVEQLQAEKKLVELEEKSVHKVIRWVIHININTNWGGNKRCTFSDSMDKRARFVT